VWSYVHPFFRHGDGFRARLSSGGVDNDVGLTHVALVVSDIDATIAFYAKYARMQVVHDRQDGDRVVWITDLTRPFVVVLAQGPPREHPLGPFGHLGVGCESREEIDRRCAEARLDGCLTAGPTDSGFPIGYWAFLRDPDGHTLELSFGQEIGFTVEAAKD
jgi:catechol 2,3-dioxygenase-like lactoylglutathione lyase family enzyme